MPSMMIPMSAMPAKRNSIGNTLRSAAYFTKKARPKNNTVTPTLTMMLPVVKKCLTQSIAASTGCGNSAGI